MNERGHSRRTTQKARVCGTHERRLSVVRPAIRGYRDCFLGVHHFGNPFITVVEEVLVGRRATFLLVQAQKWLLFH
jgi:hypothetical protein